MHTNDARPLVGTLNQPSLFQEAAYLQGTWCAPAGVTQQDVLNPGTGAVIGQVPVLGASEAQEAVSAADAAFASWSTALPQERAALLRRWFELMLEHQDDLARLMTEEQGKPLSEARGEVEYGASFAEFFAEQARRPDVLSITSHLPNAEVEVWMEPLGVAALVTPWNFPNAMLVRKAAAALSVGCTVVAHPSMQTPYSALALAVLAEEAGFPPGVFNVITGAPEVIVGEWMQDPRVRALSFTGSTPIGRLLYQQSADTLKRLSLELGGHAPFLVFEDADLERAVEEAIKAKFATSGQDCLAANRILVHTSLYDAFCERFANAVQSLSVGLGKDDPDIGPLINAAAVQKQQEHVADALQHGAQLLCGGAVLEQGPNFFAPTVLKDVPRSALIMHDETFGPVAPIAAFQSEEEAVSWANDTEYGLMAYVHTRNPSRIYRVSRALKFGMIGVNRTKVTGAPIPFGGMKQSGWGREGSRYGLDVFADIKYVCRDWS